MAVSLTTYLNNQIKGKGSTLAKEKAKAGKYKSIAAAKKAGALYYTDKNGKVMAAVYAEDLKKAPTKTAAPKKSLRPRARPNNVGSTLATTAEETAEVKKRNAEIKLAERARKNTGPNAARKKPMANKNGSGYLKNKNLDATITYKKYQNMSAEEKKAAGLPISMGQTEKSFNRFMAARKKSKK
jgi:hypothetical protein